MCCHRALQLLELLEKVHHQTVEPLGVNIGNGSHAQIHTDIVLSLQFRIGLTKLEDLKSQDLFTPTEETVSVEDAMAGEVFYAEVAQLALYAEVPIPQLDLAGIVEHS